MNYVLHYALCSTELRKNTHTSQKEEKDGGCKREE